MESNIKNDAIKGVGWSAIERFSVQGVNFLIQLVLARLLSPSDYGIIGILTVFIQVSQVFIDSGFSNALIKKKNCDKTDYSTVFFYNIAIAIIIYIILYISAPFIASFYNIDELRSVMRVLAIVLIFNALSIVQRTILIKAIDFKTQSFVTLGSALISGAIGIYLAYIGYSVWALCIQQLLNSLFQIVFYSYKTRWVPAFVFSKSSFCYLFNFGSKLLISSLINTVYRNLYVIVIGKTFSAGDLGCFSRADQFAQFPSNNFANIVSRVAFPVLSKVQDENEKLVNIYRETIRYTSLVIFPLMFFLLFFAKSIIILLLTETWSPVIILLQILCLDWMIDHISVLNLNLLYVKGRSDLALKLEIIKKIIAVSILICTIPFGLIPMCWGRVVYSVIATLLNTSYTKRLIGLSFYTQLQDFTPFAIISFLSSCLAYFVTSYIDSMLVNLIVGAVLFSLIYLIFIKFFCKKTYTSLILTIKKYIR